MPRISVWFSIPLCVIVFLLVYVDLSMLEISRLRSLHQQLLDRVCVPETSLFVNDTGPPVVPSHPKFLVATIYAVDGDRKLVREMQHFSNKLQGFVSAGLLPAMIDNRKEYAARHGYDVDIQDHSEDDTRPTSWSRVRYLIRRLPEYEWIFYIDGDAIVTNMAVRLEDLVDENCDIIFGQDVLPYNPLMNAGVILARNTSWTIDWLEQVLAPPCLYSTCSPLARRYTTTIRSTLTTYGSSSAQ